MRIKKGDVVFIAIAALSGAACYHYAGADAVLAAMVSAGHLLLVILPQLAAGLLIGGLVQQFVSRERVAAWLGQGAGLRGLIFATLAGILTPGGPFASFPLVYALWVAGAGAGALVAFVTAWSLVGLHRLFIWEIPFMGAEFSILRFAVSLPLPIIAGLAAQWITEATPLKLREAPQA